MIKHNQDGAVNGSTVSLIFAVILLVGAISFGAWAFASRSDYKNNADAKATVVANKAVAQNSIKKDKQFAEDSKNPLRTYNGPETLGSVVIQFPKTWSGYVASDGANTSGLDVVFDPNVVPPTGNQDTVYSLRVQVLNQSYPSVVSSLSGQQGQQERPTVSAYALPKLPKVVGVKITGKLPSRSTTATVVVLPLRSQTLQIETDGTQFLDDYNNYILPNFSFSP